ncbi:MAG: transposase, partial [Streptococcus hyointestinalis]
RIYAKRKVDVEPVFGRMKGVFGVRRVHVRGQKVVETEIGFLLMSMNLTKLAKKLVQESRNRKKNTDSSAGFHLKQLESIGVFYLLTSFCPASCNYSELVLELSDSLVELVLELVTVSLNCR